MRNENNNESLYIIKKYLRLWKRNVKSLRLQ